MAASVFIKCPSRLYRLFCTNKTLIALKVPGSYILSINPAQSSCRIISTSSKLLEKLEDAKENQETPPKVLSIVTRPDDEYIPQEERFVPITRRSILRHLMQEPNFLNSDEQRHFERFSQALDSAIVNKYHGVLQELKSLFDPINPDKDTISTRQWNRKERLDNEFWLLQKLANVMEKANFHELNRPTIEKALKEHKSDEGVLVSVDPDKYDILRYWALGRQTSQTRLPLYKRLAYKLAKQPTPAPLEYYKRVIVAVRLKRDDKLLLKAFKEVPINALEQLLPDGKIKMSQFDKTIIYSSVGLASLGLLAKFVTYLAHIQVQWTLILTAVTALTAVNALNVYKNRRNTYLVELSKMLYFKNIANNRGLLALLVDRAEDELFKEALLTYTFLLTNRAPSVMQLGSTEQDPKDLGGLTKEALEQKISDWVYKKTKTRITFNSQEALRLLSELGVLNEDTDALLHVMSLEAGLRNLPITPQSMVPRAEEYDVIEGFDRSVYLETDDEYKKEETKRKKYGWF